jgi:hypothetical protein
MTPQAVSQGSASTQTVDAVMARAVRTSCDAIKSSIEQCRTTAQLVCTGQYGVARIPRDVTDFVCRFVRLTGELSTNCFDLLAACMGTPAATGSAQPQPAEQSGATGMSEPMIQLVSRKMADPTLSPLTPTSSAAVPTVAGLRSHDPTLPVIHTVRFAAAPDRSRLVLHIRISDDQPAGIYSGTVIDSDTQQAIGTLTVRIRD